MHYDDVGGPECHVVELNRSATHSLPGVHLAAGMHGGGDVPYSTSLLKLNK